MRRFMTTGASVVAGAAMPLASARGARFLRGNLWKAVRLVGGGNAGLLAAMVSYRVWWRLRGLDLGIVPVSDLGLDPIHSSYHKNGGGPQLERVLEQLDIAAHDVALDLGAGKGGAMITMARLPFQRIDGVELAPALVEAACSNFEKLGLRRCHVILGDAAAYAELDDYTVVFMFHAFSDAILDRVLANLAASLDRHPRRARLVYENPVDEALILRTGRFERVLDYHPYREFRISVYETVSAPPATSGAAAESLSTSIDTRDESLRSGIGGHARCPKSR